MSFVLECSDVSVRFGAFVAVSGLSYRFESGKVYGLIGPNGAGKTTLMNAIVGRQSLASGTIRLGGRDVTGFDVPSRARLGLGRSFQITKIFSGMTVFENLRLAAQMNAFRWQPAWRPASGYREIADQARAMLAEIDLERHAQTEADKLSHGDQRALELGLTLITRPTVLLLDEPLAGVGHQGARGAVALLERVIRPNVSVWAVDPDGDPLGLYLRSLGELKAALPDDVLVLPGHQLPFHGLHRRASQLISHHEERCCVIAEACRVAPKSAAELVPVIFPRVLDPHQMSFAFSEVQAHINYMLRIGRLRWSESKEAIQRVNAT